MAGRVGAHMTISLDGFGAGPDQTLETPLGVGGQNLHRWMFLDGENNAGEMKAICDYSAFIMGRNMFGPIRGEWTGDWRGWWDENPPYHAPVYVLTHYPREPLVMEGGTTFHFITDGPDAALAAARSTVGDGSIAIAGGVSTTRHYLNAGVIDDLHLQMAPIVLGAGERLWDGLTAELEPVSARATRFATHLHYRVKR
ncbi:dihydrofolate reductase family protein [Brevundimonas sp.]|uniref:dihydrofolate reductase family protein n=1 Tax=Brevundimonas sp. TaxID=1871086 RepID=UPI003D0E2F4A